MRHLKIIALCLLCLGLAALVRAEPEAKTANAFSPIKGKLAAGKDAVLFINGDSTAYSEHGPYYKFAKSLGEATGGTVVLRRWAEWVGGKPTGPKDYAEPVTLHTGKSGATLTVYLAALPGAVAGDMFAGSRRPAAIDALPRPDCALLHHGHNMLSYPAAFKGERASGRGLFFGVIGLTASKWPGVPQAVVTQNPWRDQEHYAKVYNAIRDVADLHPQLTLIDSHAAFMAAGKDAGLYRDNIHPSDSAANSAGAQKVTDALMAAWNAAKPGAAFATPAWPLKPGAGVFANGDFADWTEDVPAGWMSGENAVIEKTTAATHAGEPYALAIRPNGNKLAFLGKHFNEAEIDAVRGKTVSIAMLVRASSAQPRAYASFVCPVEGRTRTFAFGDLNSGRDGWVWMVCAGIPVDETATENSVYLRVFPAFGLTEPTSDEPLIIQRVVVVEDSLPHGALKAEVK